MELAEAYRQIEKRLEMLDFSALFRGFHRFPFALYNDAKAYMNGEYFNKPDSFLGNTAVKYSNEDTAIWKLTEETADYDILTSKIVHEMLHAFQRASGETRWADEREALVKYQYDAINLSTRLEEAACMKNCLSGTVPEAFEQLTSLRKARFESFPYAYEYEARIEQIEGTALFVELSALRQLNEEKAAQRWEETLTALADPMRYFPVRSITYLSGAAFLACLHKYTDFSTDVFNDQLFAVSSLQHCRPVPLSIGDPGMKACLEHWTSQAQAVVEKAKAKSDPVLAGTHRLIIWNVYDAYWDGHYAILSAFMGFIDGTELPKTDEELFSEMTVINGDYVADLDRDFCLHRVWKQ